MYIDVHEETDEKKYSVYCSKKCTVLILCSKDLSVTFCDTSLPSSGSTKRQVLNQFSMTKCYLKKVLQSVLTVFFM
jgi:hypothetical protein